jgi:hypothetical protein
MIIKLIGIFNLFTLVDENTPNFLPRRTDSELLINERYGSTRVYNEHQTWKKRENMLKNVRKHHDLETQKKIFWLRHRNTCIAADLIVNTNNGSRE